MSEKRIEPTVTQIIDGKEVPLDTVPVFPSTKPAHAVLFESLRKQIPDDDDRFREVCRIVKQEPENVPDVDMVLPVLPKKIRPLDEEEPIQEVGPEPEPEPVPTVTQAELDNVMDETIWKVRHAMAILRAHTGKFHNLSADQALDAASVINSEPYESLEVFKIKRKNLDGI